jgi:hypothetical protein
MGGLVMAEKDSTTELIEAVDREIEDDIKILDRLGNCLRTLADAQEKFELNTLEVTTAQLKSWSLLCYHVAMWVPENMAGAIKEFYEGQARPEGQGGEG